MIRSASFVAFATFATLALAMPGCRKKEDSASKKSAQLADDDDEGASAVKKKSKKKSKASDEEADDEGTKAKPSKGCKLPEGNISADFTVPKGCKLTVKEPLQVDEGAKLVLEPGSTLAFGPKARLFIDHGSLVAKGTEDEPITFTSANKSRAAGDWEGIVFGEKVMAGTVLSHVVIEFAGAEGYRQGALAFYGGSPAGRVSVTDSVIRNVSHAAVHNEESESTFAKFEGNVFSEVDGVAFEIDANVLGSIGKNKLGGALIHVRGSRIVKSATWPALDGVYVIGQDLAVEGDKEAAILTLPPKAKLKFAPGTNLWIGGSSSTSGGGLVATGVEFTSAGATPNAGDWKGLVFDNKSTGTKLVDCSIAYAGKEGYGKAAVTFYNWSAKSAQKRVTLTNLTVSHAEHGALLSVEDHDCGPYLKEVHADGPLCVKDE